ncbi:hypothetical protein Rmf_40040 [Roseomonas fluvialis]|uniref:Uncharacterized protein n=1 Tax=Roseomonas fluvialis TaxID=1750527 RepID=A0ABN6P963_9PROT|nr:hypothetical protein Rmf_40040 [Roseomonas fluvialis]
MIAAKEVRAVASRSRRGVAASARRAGTEAPRVGAAPSQITAFEAPEAMRHADDYDEPSGTPLRARVDAFALAGGVLPRMRRHSLSPLNDSQVPEKPRRPFPVAWETESVENPTTIFAG